MAMQIWTLTYFFLKSKTGKTTRGHDVTQVNVGQMLESILSPRGLSWVKINKIINQWNKLSADCVHSSSINISNNIIKQLSRKSRIPLYSYIWTFDKQTGSFSTAI